jgi:4-amino-4-deoxy-L-arabinose transferase-like glycosyltransferase
MINSKPIYAISALLMFAGIFIPSFNLIKFFRGIPPVEIQEQLLLGANIFKAGLFVLGFFIIMLGMFSFLKPETKKLEPILRQHHKLTMVILSIVIFTAFALRLYALDLGLWYDEIMTYVKYARMPFGNIVTTYDSQNNHFLFSLLAHSSFLTFGESAWSLRLPAVLFGVGSIFAIYLLGRQVCTTREALLSTALLTFSYHHIWFSQNARGYTGLLFWTILASWLFLKASRDNQRSHWMLYAITVTLGAYTHMMMVLIIFGHFLIHLFTLITNYNEIGLEKLKGLFFGFCLAGLITFQLHALILPQLFGGALWIGVESAVAEWKNPIWAIFGLVKGMQVGFTSYITAIVAFIIFGIGLLSFTSRNPMILLLLFVPVIIVTATMMAMGHPLWPRNFFFTIGFGAIIVVRGTMWLGVAVAKFLHFDSKKSNLVGTVLCGGLIFVSAISIPKVYAPKQDYLGTLNFIEEKREPGDVVVTVGVVATAPFKTLYKVDWKSAETLDELNLIRSNAKRTWLLYTMSLYLQNEYPEIMFSIQRDFKIEKEFYGTLGNGTIVVCKSEIPPSS